QRTIEEDFDSVPPPDFNSTWYCNNIFVRLPTTTISPVHTFVEYKGNKTPCVEFEEQEGVLLYRFLDRPTYDQIVEASYKDERWEGKSEAERTYPCKAEHQGG